MPPPSADESALLAAVAADPGAELPKLVLANYFEERADPRGEYIRLECHLSHLAVEHADWPLVAGRMAELRAESPAPIEAWADHVGAARTMAALPRLREKLERLRRHDRRRRHYGAGRHGYRVNPCRTEAQVAGFEARHGVRLPGEYRAFVRHFGDGGAGPDNGMTPLPDGTEASLAVPFPVSTAQGHDLATRRRVEPNDVPNPYDLLAESDGDWPGCLGLSDAGCGTYAWLVVGGDLRGAVCYIGDYLVPLLGPHGHPLGFLDWYEAWLDSSLATPPRL